MPEDFFACANEECISTDEATDVVKNEFGDKNLVTQSKKRRHKQSYAKEAVEARIKTAAVFHDATPSTSTPISYAIDDWRA